MEKEINLPAPGNLHERIIFFDGLCPMCHGWMKRILRWDRKKIFRFAALESEMAKTILGGVFPGYLKEDTIVLFDQGVISIRSTAALHILGYLRFPYNLSAVAWMIPRFIRDVVYRRIASQRYKYGQRYDSCPMPPMEWRERFMH